MKKQKVNVNQIQLIRKTLNKEWILPKTTQEDLLNLLISFWLEKGDYMSKPSSGDNTPFD